MSEGECLANAKLIAAAPELLKACQEAMGNAGKMVKLELYNKLKAAIAKATGI